MLTLNIGLQDDPTCRSVEGEGKRREDKLKGRISMEVYLPRRGQWMISKVDDLVRALPLHLGGGSSQHLPMQRVHVLICGRGASHSRDLHQAQILNCQHYGSSIRFLSVTNTVATHQYHLFEEHISNTSMSGLGMEWFQVYTDCILLGKQMMYIPGDYSYVPALR